MALVGILTRNMESTVILITLMTASMAISCKINVTISDVEYLPSCRPVVDECWRNEYWVCVKIATDDRNWQSTTFNCNDPDQCSFMQMTSKIYTGPLLSTQNVCCNETLIIISFYEIRTIGATCSNALTTDCRNISSSYHVNNTHFSFQVTLSDIPDVSTSVPTTQQTDTLSTSSETLTSLIYTGVSNTTYPLSSLSTSTLTDSSTVTNDSRTSTPGMTSPTSKGTDTGKGSLIGGVVGGVVFLVALVFIIGCCCWKHKCKNDAVAPKKTGQGQEPVSKGIDQTTIKDPNMPVEGEISRQGTTLSTSKVPVDFPEKSGNQVITSLPPGQTFISAPGQKWNDDIADYDDDDDNGKSLPPLPLIEDRNMEKKKKEKKKKKKKKREEKHSEHIPVAAQNDEGAGVAKESESTARKEEKPSDVPQNYEHATMLTDKEVLAKKERRRRRKEKRERERKAKDGLLDSTTPTGEPTSQGAAFYSANSRNGVVEGSHAEIETSLPHNDRTQLLPPRHNDQEFLIVQEVTVSQNESMEPSRKKKKKKRKLEEEPDAGETSVINIDG